MSRPQNRELDEFAYAASHDLQAPLRHVEQFSSILQDELKGKLTPDQEVYFGFVIEGVVRMRRLINDLLQWSRAGSAEDFTEVSLDVVVADALKNLTVDITESGAKITIAPHLPRVIGHEPTLKQVVQNLVGNAIKFRDETRTCEVHVGAEAVGSNVHVWVRDNGIGIDAIHLQKVFDLFSRLNPRERYDGTGIGLAICRRIVDEHGGKIWAESAGIGAGSTFHFELPQAVAAHEEAPNPPR